MTDGDFRKKQLLQSRIQTLLLILLLAVLIAAVLTAADNLSDLDVDSLNTLVQALENTANKLQSAVNAITGIFH